MLKEILIILFLVQSFASFSQKKEEIEKVIFEQQELWNKGDIPAFMEYYWKSEELMFVGKNGITKGWENTLTRYLKTYPDRKTMGTLAFEIKNLDFHSIETAWVLGKWNLKRPEVGDIGGYFTLVFKKINGKWLIISDHTS